ncbi:MAG: hypothetical protein WCY36_08065 [Candidatus Omnitrophota bacterium]
MNKKNQILVTFFIGSITAFLLLEAGLRIEGAFERVPLSARINPKSRQNNVFTILCLGNSHTRGIGAGRGESYPNQLQKLFDKEVGRNKVRVINAGRSSQNSGELLDDLEYSINKMKPDLIVLQTGQPNFWNLNKYGRYLGRERGGGLSFRKFIFYSSDILYNSCVYRLSLLLISKIKEKLRCAIINKYNSTEPNDNGVDAGVSWVRLLEQDCDNNLPCVIDSAKAKAVVTVFKQSAESSPRYACSYYRYIGEIYFFQKEYKEAAEWFIKSIKTTLGMDYNGIRYYIKYLHNIPGHEGINNLINGPDEGFARFLGTDFYSSRHCLQYMHNNLKDEAIKLQIDSAEDTFKLILSEPFGRGAFFTNDEIYKWLDSDFKEIFRIIQDKKVKIILQNFAPTENMAECREANLFNSIYIPGIALKFNIPFIDNNRIFQKILNKGEKGVVFFASDGHCNVKGYEVIAANIFNKIEEEKIIYSEDHESHFAVYEDKTHE